MWEIIMLLDLLPYAQKYSYDRMRNIMWANLKPYLKNQNMTPEKLLPLYTDKNDNIEGLKPLEEEEIIKLREKVLEQWNNTHIQAKE